MQNMNQCLYSQKTPHISPSWASYGMSIVIILEKFDRVIMAPHFSREKDALSYEWGSWTSPLLSNADGDYPKQHFGENMGWSLKHTLC